MDRRPHVEARSAQLTQAKQAQGRSAAHVAAGILASRLSGFARDVLIASTFGVGPLMDAYAFALRVPNFFRNLLSEGALSASFVPIFSALLGEEEEGEARRLGQNVLGLLLVLSGLVVAVGLAAAPWIVAALGPGFDSETSEVATGLVRILFPMSGVMVIGAWCLGILTSHRKFFLPFVAPVLWNAAQIVGLLLGARMGWEPMIVVLAWSTLIGSFAQVAIQLPAVHRLLGTLRPRVDTKHEPTRRTVKNTGPVTIGQGIFQISSIADVVLASLLVNGALASLYFAQRIALVPLALFGVSVAVSALPEMSREEGAEALREHITRGAGRVLYFVVPSTVILFLFGDLIAAILFQRGRFTADDTQVVRWVLAAYALGLIATSLTKLFASAYHALQDTKTPVLYAAISIAVGIATGATLAFWMDAADYGTRAAAGLAAGGAVGGWLNFLMLMTGLRKRGVGAWSAPIRGALMRMVIGASLAGALGWTARSWLEPQVPAGLWGWVLLLASVLAVGGVVYIAVAGSPRRRAA